MAWRIAGDSINKHFVPYLPTASTFGGMFYSTDIGKLVQASSYEAHLFGMTSSSGSTNAITANTVLGILAALDASPTTAGSTAQRVWVQRVTRGEKLEVDYSTNSTDIGSTNSILATTNKGMWMRICGAGTSSGTLIGGGYIDPTTGGVTLAATTVGCFRMFDFSTTRRVVTGTLDYSLAAY